jgi:hypothetical protein
MDFVINIEPSMNWLSIDSSGLESQSYGPLIQCNSGSIADTN